MLEIRTIASTLLISAVSLGLITACGGESKPPAKSPPAEAAAKDGDPQPGVGDKANEIAHLEKGKAGGDKVKVVEGKAPGGDDRYALQIEPPADAAAGVKGEVVVRVVPKEPWHMNLDFPTSLKVEAPAGVSLANAALKKGDARKLDASSCEFAVEFTPDAAGEHAFTGQFKFAVCQDEACSPVTEDVSFKVAVK